MKKFNTIHTGCAILLAAGVSSAYGQAAPTDDEGEIQEVVVSGIRAAINSAMEEKKNNSSIVEAITAEDIGKLPDTSIAESISRLPGLTSQRANGRASAISLRGTDPAFTSALLNGREQVSTGDNRSIEFDQYPSELLSSVVVYKTPDTQLVGQGLAGTIDLRTQRPLDYGKRAMVLNIRGERNSHDALGADATDKGYRASFSYIDQFADDKFGITFGYARLSSPLATEGVGAYEPWHLNLNPNDPNATPQEPNIPGDVYITNGMKIRTDMGKNVRDGAMAAFQFKPSESFSSILDLYYTKSKETDNARSLEWNLSNYPADTLFSDLVIENNTLVGATTGNLRPLARNFQFVTHDKIFAAGLNNRWEVGDWALVGDVSYSRAVRNQFQPETNAQFGTCAGGGDAACLDTGTFRLFGGSRLPEANFGLDYADPANIAFGPTIYGAGYVKKPHVKDELKSARIDLSRQLESFVDSVAFGINYADRSKDKRSPENDLSTIQPGSVFIDEQYLKDPTSLHYTDSGTDALAWSVPGVLDAYYQPITYRSADDFAYLVGKWWTVNEKVTTSYVRGNLNYELSSSVTLKGNVGVQMVHTDQSSDSRRVNTGGATAVIEPFTDGRKYTDWLPALNFAFLFPSDQALRVGVAREIARARMDQLKASSEIGCGQGTGLCGGDQGNSHLAPWRADAFDLAYEKYFSTKGGYFSAAGFYKKLKTYIYPLSDGAHDFSDFIATLPPGYFQPGTVVNPIGTLTQPVNGSGGSVKGVELAVSLPGEMFTEALRGFGTILSFSHTTSGIAIIDPPGTNTTSGTGFGEIPLPGLSKNVWNATVYYERAGFSARVATRARSKYIGEITNFANDRAFRFIKGDQITDLQLGYEFGGETRLQGLGILLQVNNLTNEPYVAYAVEEERLIDYQTYGRQVLFGFNYKF